MSEESLKLINQRLTLDEIIPQLYPTVEISRAISGTTLDHFRPLYLSKVCVKWVSHPLSDPHKELMLHCNFGNFSRTFDPNSAQGQDIDISLDARIQKTKV